MIVSNLISKLAARIKISSQERNITGSHRQDYMDSVWEMYQSSYGAIG